MGLSGVSGRQFLGSFSAADFASCVASLAQPSTTACKLAGDVPDTNPELVVLFLTPELSTTLLSRFGDAYSSSSATGGAFRHLKQALEKSPASVSVPYAALGDNSATLSELLAQTLRLDVPAESRVLLAGDVFAASSPFAELVQSVLPVDELSARLPVELMSNGVTDFLVVLFPQRSMMAADELAIAEAFAAQDAHMGDLTAQIASATGNRFVAFFTGLESETPASLNDVHVHHARNEFNDLLGELVGESSNSTNSSGSYWPPEVLAGTISFVFLGVVLTVMVWLTAEIQTPDRFETPPKQAGQRGQ